MKGSPIFFPNQTKVLFKIALILICLALFPLAQARAEQSPANATDFLEEGLASWYGDEFAGRPTASGEPFDPTAMTAAHKYLPMNATVKVTNLENQASVLVRINDRGPYTPGRIIEVSRAAAQVLGLEGKGQVMVRVESAVEVKHPEQDDLPGAFYIQLAAFGDQAKAQALYDQLAQKNVTGARIVQVAKGEAWIYRVQIGVYDSLAKAQAALAEVKGEFPDAFVVADTVKE